MWGSCQPINCDWGIVRATLSNGSSPILAVQWTTKIHVVTQTILILSDGRLNVTSHTHFTDNSRRPDYDSRDFFVKQ
jgi:hypothetical protein